MNLVIIMRLILGIIATTFIGWVVLRMLLRNERRPIFEEAALSYGLGMGVVLLEFIIFWFFNIRPMFVNIVIPWLIVAIIFRKSLFRIGHSRVSMRKSASLFEVFLFAGIIFEVVFSFFRALIKPIESFDSIAMYAIRAKVFYEAGRIPADFFSSITKLFPNSGHPLMVPVAEAWVYTFLGTFNDFLVKIIFPLYLAALLLVFFYALRDIFGRRESLLFTFMLATIPQFVHFSSIGYADFVLAFYFSVSALYILKWIKTKRTPYLVLSAFMMALACWTKMEGWALFLSSILVLLLYSIRNFKYDKNVFIRLAGFGAIVLVIAMPWILLINETGLENRVYQFKSFGPGRLISTINNLDRCPRILYEFQKQFFGPKKWNIIWILVLALFMLNIKAVFKGDMQYAPYLLFLIMLFYCSSYLLIPLKENEPINVYISTTLSRLFIHFTPLAAYWIADLCKEKGYV